MTVALFDDSTPNAIEGSFLKFEWAFLQVIVEPCFTERDDSRVIDPLEDPVPIASLFLIAIGGMDSDRGKDRRMGLGQLHALRLVSAVVATAIIRSHPDCAAR